MGSCFCSWQLAVGSCQLAVGSWQQSRISSLTPNSRLPTPDSRLPTVLIPEPFQLGLTDGLLDHLFDLQRGFDLFDV